MSVMTSYYLGTEEFHCACHADTRQQTRLHVFSINEKMFYAPQPSKYQDSVNEFRYSVIACYSITISISYVMAMAMTEDSGIK